MFFDRSVGVDCEAALSMDSLGLGSVSVVLLLVYSSGPLAQFACGTTWPVRESATVELLVCTKD